MSTERVTVSINQACVAAGVCRRTIYNWIRDQKVEYVRTAGGSIRIYRDSLFRTPAPTPVQVNVSIGGTQIAEAVLDGIPDALRRRGTMVGTSGR